MGLTPKKDLKQRNQNWEDLDKKLQNNLNYVGDTTIIRVSDYPGLTKESIINEGKKNGYTISENDNGQFLYFSWLCF